MGTLFHGLAAILSCHMRLRAALTTAISNWDKVWVFFLIQWIFWIFRIRREMDENQHYL